MAARAYALTATQADQWRELQSKFANFIRFLLSQPRVSEQGRVYLSALTLETLLDLLAVFVVVHYGALREFRDAPPCDDAVARAWADNLLREHTFIGEYIADALSDSSYGSIHLAVRYLVYFLEMASLLSNGPVQR